MSDTDPDQPADTVEGLMHRFEAGLAALAQAPPGDIEHQVEQRRALAQELGLAQRLLRIYDALKFVPDARRRLLQQHGCAVHALDIRGAERATAVRFDYGSRAYTLTFKEAGGYEEVRARLDLEQDGGDGRFTVRLAFDVNEWGPAWTPRDVDAFIPGDWVKDILELSTLLEAKDEPPEIPPEQADREAIKKRFGL